MTDSETEVNRCRFCGAEIDEEPHRCDHKDGQMIPALNEITAQTGSDEPEYPDDDYRYLILYPEDYEEHGVDMAGNVALLVDEDGAQEVKRIAEAILEELVDDE